MLVIMVKWPILTLQSVYCTIKELMHICIGCIEQGLASSACAASAIGSYC